ncbi:MAG: hypothetical protein HY261_08305 [Chloroflexi bacterium]|nr:hypothetical protein [Chloroflexota bacterium]
MTSGVERAEAIDVPDYHAAVEMFFERGWTDGLAIVPPTEAKVEEMVRYSGRDALETLGAVPPFGGLATIEKLAVNAVMAGCKPEYFPVVIAAVDAMLDPSFNLNGVQTTTHGGEPLLIVNGPVIKQLGFMYGDGVFGSGSRANGTVGRAVQLILWNLGQNPPGEVDKACMDHPGNWSFCIAEDEDGSPWEPLHVERGLPREVSAVTVFHCEAPHSIGGAPVPDGLEELLRPIAATMGALGNNNVRHFGETLLVLNPLQAALFYREGWSKRDVKQAVWARARNKAKQFSRSAFSKGIEEQVRKHAPWINFDDPEQDVPITLSPDDIHIVVAGGRSYFAACCPGWGYYGGNAITREVRIPKS